MRGSGCHHLAWPSRRSERIPFDRAQHKVDTAILPGGEEKGSTFVGSSVEGFGVEDVCKLGQLGIGRGDSKLRVALEHNLLPVLKTGRIKMDCICTCKRCNWVLQSQIYSTIFEGSDTLRWTNSPPLSLSR